MKLARELTSALACGCLLTVLALSLLAGCRRATPEEVATRSLAGHFELELTSKSQDSQIQNELSRIEAERGLPAQLQTAEDQLDPQLDLAAAFFDAFDSDWQLQTTLGSLKDLWPQGSLDFGDDLYKARQLVSANQERREVLRAALRHPDSRFRLDFTQGVAADLRWLAGAEALARWEAIEVDHAVSSRRPNSAIEPLSTMFRLAYKLGQAPQLTTRLLAGDVRRLALQGVQRVATCSQATPATRQLLLEMIEEQLSHWPDEAMAWHGDRAIGLHVYEMVRAGEYLTLLTDEEADELEKRRETMDRYYVVMMNVDADEHFYLETMRELLKLCDQPYYQRKATWDERFDRLTEWRGGRGFPRIAADIMFPAFSTAQQQIARDRTRCEAWRMALRKSLDKPTGKVTHYVTGEPLYFSDEVGVIRVLGLEIEDEDLQPELLPAARE